MSEGLSEGKTDVPEEELPANPVEVKYLGASTIRTISKDEWSKQQKVEGQDSCYWGPENNWSMPIEKFSQAALAYIKKDTSGLVIR